MSAPLDGNGRRGVTDETAGSRKGRKSASKSGASGLTRPVMQALALEPRLMFDAAAAATAVTVAGDIGLPVDPTESQTRDFLATLASLPTGLGQAEGISPVADLAPVGTNSDGSLTPMSETMPLSAWGARTVTGTTGQDAVENDQLSALAIAEVTPPIDIEPTTARRELVIIDQGVSDYRTLLTGIDPTAEVVFLPAGGDGVKALAALLAGYQGQLDAIHLVSHGAGGALFLGNAVLYWDNVDAYTPELATIGSALKDGGDLMLYGCTTAGGLHGAEFMEALDRALGDVDIAASTDKTGPLVLGGDWDLEYLDGDVDTVLPFSVAGMQEMDHCLGCTVSSTVANVNLFDNNLTLNSASAYLNPAGVIVGYRAETGHFNGDTVGDGEGATNLGGPFGGEGGTTYTILHQGFGDQAALQYADFNGTLNGFLTTIENTFQAFINGGGCTESPVLATNAGATLNNGATVQITSSIFQVTDADSTAGQLTFKVTDAVDNGTLFLDENANGSFDSGTDTALVLNSTFTQSNINDGKLRFTHNGGATTTDSFGFTAQDEQSATTRITGQAFSLTINDITAPTLDGAGSTPADNATGVALGDNIVIDFSESIQFGSSGTITLRNVTGSTDAETFNVASVSGGTVTGSNGSSMTISGDKLTINPNGSLSSATAYSVRFAAGSIEDIAGNDLAAVADDTTYNFTTVAPAITSATYNASTNVLTVMGTNLTNGGAIDETKLTLTGQDGSTYTLTDTGTITASSTTEFSITLNATDQLNVEGLLNKAGTSAVGGTTYNIAGAADWHGTGNADTTGNGVTVSNVQTPTITSATYDASTGVLTVTGTNLVKQSGATNDIDLSKLTITGQGGSGSSYTLTTASDVEITSASSFTATLSGADKTSVDALLNANGTQSSGSTTYNLAVADDWNGPIADANTEDLTGNAITVSGVITNTNPVITNLNGDTHEWANGTYVFLDDFNPGTIASASDTENDSGNWDGGTLTIQRSATGSTASNAWSADVFGFSSIYYTATATNATSGTLAYYTQGVGQSFASYTNTGGTLTITFNANATSTFVSSIFSGITYENATAAGDASFLFTLTDGDGGSTTATTTVTSDTIYVTNATDTATIDVTDGVSFSEAIAIAAADTTGSQTIIFGSGLAAGTITLAGDIAVGESLTIDADAASGLTLTGSTISIGSGHTLTFTNETSDTLTVASALSGDGALIKAGAGTATLSGSNLYAGTTSVSGGTLSVAGDGNLGGGAVTLAAGTTLTVSGASTIDNAITLSGAATLNIGAAVTLSGAVTGSTTLTKSGSGALTLSNSGNASSLTGAMTVTAGTLSVAGDSNLGSGTLTLNGGGFTVTGAATIDNAIAVSAAATITNANAVTLSGALSGAGAIIKDGVGALTLSATNSANLSGTLEVRGGTLAVAGDDNLTSGTLTLNGGTLSVTGTGVTIDNAIALGSNHGTVNNANGLTLSGVISGSGTFTKTGAGTLTLSATNSHSGSVAVNAGTLAVAGDDNLTSGAITLNGGILSVTGTGVTIDNAIALGSNHGTVSNANAVTLSGVISGSGNVTKTGAGTLTLSATNTLTGATTVSGGTLSVTGDSNLGSGAVTLNSGTLTVTGSSVTIDNSISLGVDGGTISNANAITLSGILSGSGALAKAGAGTLTLSATNTFTGVTSVSAGTLSVAGDSNLGSGAVTLNSGTLTVTGSSVTIDNSISLGVDGGTISNANAITLSGVLSGSGALAKAGAGTLTLSGSNSYTGATSVSAGTLSVAGDGNLGSGAVTLNNGTLTVSGATTIDNALAMGSSGGTIDNSGAVTLSGVVSGTGALTKSGAGTLTLSGTQTGTGTTTITAGTLAVAADSNLTSGAITLNGGTLSVTGASTIDNAITLGDNNGTVNIAAAATLSGIISGTGALTKSGSSALTLTGANTFTGAFNLSTGVLIVGHDTALGTTAAGTTIASGTTMRVSNGVTVADALTISGTGVNSSFGALKINEGSGTATVSGNITLAADAAIGAYNAGDTLILSGVISGSFNLSKPGSGTLVLSGANTYSGSTTISTGTLAVTGSLGATSSVTVSSGATLSGTGGIFANSSNNNLTVASGGTLSPGIAGTNDGVGTLTVNGNLTIASGGTLAANIAGASSHDQVAVNGAVNVSNATITPTLLYTPGNGDAYVVISNDGTDSITGTFTGLAQGATVNSLGTVVALTGAYNGGSNTNDFTLTAPINDTPTISNLSGDSVAWAGVSTYVALDAGTALSIADTELGALNSGNGNWDGATLTIRRVTSGGGADGTTKDLFTFLDNATFSVDLGSSPYTNYPVQSIEAAQAAGQNATGALSDKALVQAGQDSWFARWSYTYATGTLVVEFGTTSGDGDFNVTPTTAMVQAVLQSIGYRNDTPYGDTTIRYSLSDGTTTANADVTVTSSTIYADASSDSDSQGDAADGFSLREALARGVAQTGADTIKVVLADNTTYTLTSGATAGAGDTLDLDGANGLTLAGSTLTLAGALTITDAASKSATLSSVLAGSGTLTKDGAGTLTLSGTNTHSGAVTVSAGTLTVSGGSAIGDSAAVTVASGATLALSGSETVGSLAGAGNVTLGSNTLTAGDSTSTTFSGAISGTGALTKVGSGTLTLSGTNTHSGAVTVSAGTLALSGGSSIDNTSAVTVSSGATLSLTGGGETIGSLAGAGAVSLSYTLTVGDANNTSFSGIISSTNTSGITKVGTGTLTLTGNNTYTGATTVSAGGLTLNRSGGALADTSAVTVSSGSTLTLSTNDTVGSLAGAGTVALGSSQLSFGGSNTSTTFSGTITGSSGGSLRKQGTGSITLSGTNSYVGGTDLSAGTLIAGAVGALGSGGVSFSAGTTLDLGASGSFANYIDLAANATINVATGISATLSNTIDGAGTLTKTGTGTLILTGTNTNTGTTAVSAGTLLIDGQVDGDVTVASGATLGGKGTVWTGNVTVDAGGTLAPGSVSTDNDGIGAFTLNSGNLTLNGTAAFQVKGKDSAGTDFDQIAVYGSVTVGGSAALSVTALNSYSLGNNTITLIANDDTDSLTNNSSTLVTNALIADSYLLTMGGGSDSNDVTILGNRPPLVDTNTGVTVAENATVTIGSAALSGSDPETSTATQLVYKLTTAPTKGTLFKDADGDGIVDDGEALALNASFTQDDVNNNKIKFKQDGSEAVSDSIGFSLTDKDSVTLSGQTIAITITGVNDAPVLGGFGNAIAFTEDGNAVLINSAATVSDADIGGAGTFNNGTLTIRRQSGAIAEDIFLATGGLGTLTSGGDLVLDSVTIGTVTQNADGHLSLTFNGQATAARVQSALRLIAYQNNSPDPSTAVTLTLSLTDGNIASGQGSGGVLSAEASSSVTITPVNDTPTALTLSGTSIGQSAALAGGAIGTLTVVDPDSNNKSSYSISAGNGKGFFGIAGDQLVAQGKVEAGTYDITITASDGGTPNLSTSNSFTITVTDDVAPSGYAVSFIDDLINAGERATMGFSLTGAEVGAAYSYTLTSAGGGSVGGGGTVSAINQTISIGDAGALKDGALSLSLILTDKTGNKGAEVTAGTVLDATAPAGSVAFIDSLLGLTKAQNAIVALAGLQAGDTYTYTVTSSGGGSASGSGAWNGASQTLSLGDLSGLSNGDLTLSIEQTDKAGNKGTAIIATSVLDKTPPTGSVSIEDSLLSATDMASATATVSGVTVGDTYTYTITSSGGGSASGSGTWNGASQTLSLGDLSGLTDGTLTLSIDQTDKAGNKGTAITTTTLLDKTLPTGSVSIEDNILSLADSKAATANVSGVAIGDTYSYTITSSGGGSVSGSGTWGGTSQTLSLGDLSGLTDGTLTLSIEQTDKAGNKGTAITTTTLLDKTVPAGTVSIEDSLLNLAESKAATATVSGVVAGDAYSYTLISSGGGSVSGSGTWNGASQTLSLGDLSGLTDGTLTLSIDQTDKAGNKGTAITTTTLLDKTPPTGSLSFADSKISVGESGTSTLTLAGAPAGTKFTYFIVSAAGGSVDGSGSLGDGTIALPDLAGLKDGTLTATLVLEDAAGNKSQPLTANTLLDLIITPVDLALDPASDTGVPGDGITSQRQPTIALTAPVGTNLAVDWGDGRGFIAVGVATGGTQSITLDQPYTGLGARTILVRSTDNAGAVTLSSPLALTLVPRAPTLGDVGALSLTEDATSVSLTLPLTSPDVPLSALTFTVTPGNPALIADANIDTSGSSPVLRVTPQANAFGSTSLTVTITGANGINLSASIPVTINPVNDGPVATVTDNSARAIQGQAFSFTPAGDSFRDVDIIPGGTDRLTYSLGAAPSWLSIDAATGALSGTPGINDIGSTFVQIIATDQAGLSAGIAVSLTIVASNATPVAVEDVGAVGEIELLNGASLLANDTDRDAGDVLRLSAVNGDSNAVGQTLILGSGAKLTVNADGTYVYDPNGVFGRLNNGQTGTDSFSYTVTDKAGASSSANVTVTIGGINNLPVSEDPKQVIIARNSDAVGLSIDPPVDPDGDPLTIIVTGLPGNGVTLRGDGTRVQEGDSLSPADLTRLQFDVDTGFVGDAGVLTYSISDGNSLRLGSVELRIAEEQIIGIRTEGGTASVQAEPLGNGITRYSFEVYRVAGNDPATSGAVTVQYRVEAGTGISGADFAGGTLPTGTVTLAPGESSRIITIDVVGDGLTEGDETFTVALSDLRADGLALTPRVNDPSSIDAAILDRDKDRTPPRVIAVDVPAAGSYFPGDSLTVTLTFSETVTAIDGATIPVLVGSNERLAILTGGSGSSSLTFTYTVQDSDIDRDGISIGSQLSGTIRDAAGNNAVTGFALRDGAGNAPNLADILVNTVRGKSIDGYIQGAQVFADANRNGVLDAGEVNSITDAAGNYDIGGGSGPYLMVGGRDVSTGIAFDGIYAAPPRATIINPLTTAIVGVAGLDATNPTFNAAEARVKSVLGINAGLDLFNTDPINVATDPASSSATIAAALDAQGEASKLSILLVQGSALLTGMATTPLAAGAAGNAIAAAIGAAINAVPTNGSIDFANQTVIQGVLANAASRLGINLDPAGSLTAGTAQMIAAANTRIETAQTGTGTALSRLTEMARIQVVTQGDAALAIRTGAANGSLAPAIASFTGTALDQAIATAQVGTIVPSRLSVTALDNSLTEADSGTTTYRFQVTRTGNLFGATSVDWAISGDSGLNAADFGGTLPSGSLSFADGEAVKTISIQVSGDTDIEADERFTLSLANATNGADIRTPSISATILDNDPVTPRYAGPDNIAVLAGTSTPIPDIRILDGDSATLTVTLTPTGGTISLVGTATVTTVTSVNGANGVTSVSGSVNDVNATLASLVFTPASGATTAGLRLTASDGDAATTDLDVTLPVRIASSPENRLPVQPTVIGGVATEIIGVGVRDSDSPILTITLTPTNGTVNLRSFGTATITRLPDGRVMVSGATADVNASLATIDFTALKTVREANLRITTDDLDTITPNDSDLILIQVVQSPDLTLPTRPLVVAGISTPVTGIILADADSDSLSVTLTPTGGTIALTAAGSATIVDAGAGTLRLTGSVADINATLALLRYTASIDATSASIRIRVVDNDARSPDADQALTLNVAAQPVVTLPTLVPIRSGVTVAVPGISLADRDSTSLTVTLTPTAGALNTNSVTGVTVSPASSGGITLGGTTAAINSALATLTVTLPLGTGTASIGIAANDGVTPQVTRTLTLPIITNVAPAAGNDLINVDAGTVLTRPAATGLLANDRDSDPGDRLRIHSVNGQTALVGQTITLDTGARITIQADGAFTIDTSGRYADIPAGGAYTETLTYQVADREGERDSATVSFTILGRNDAPTATAVPVTLADARAGAAYSATLPTGLFSDVDAGDSLTLSVRGLPAGLVFDAATGTISGTPDFSGVGTQTLTLTATDKQGASVSRTLTLVVGQDAAAMLPPPAPIPVASLDAPTVAFAPPSLPILSPGGASVDLIRFGDALDVTRINGIDLKISSDREGLAIQGAPAADGKPYIRVADPAQTGRLITDPATGMASYRLPAGSFISHDGKVAVTATLAGGKPLPAWLRFDAKTGTFVMREAPPAGTPARLIIDLSGRSSDGQQASIRLTLRVAEQSGSLEAPLGKATVSSAIRAATTSAIHLDGLALLNSLSSLPTGPSTPTAA